MPKAKKNPTRKTVQKQGANAEKPKLILDFFVFFSLAVLLVSTIFWSYLGAKVQLSNADQLVNTYLFDNFRVFHTAVFPAAHSFLVKWPIFWLISTIGAKDWTFIAFTILTSVVTVGVLAYIMYRINSRPIIFSVLILALAGVLMLVPPTPYAGGILPVNMAMIATRNLEYILYIASLAMLIRGRDFTDRWFWLGGAALGILIASDKLFLTLSFGGAVIALAVYAILDRKELARLCYRWLAMTLAAFVIATVVIWVINASGLTNIEGASSPYKLVHDFKTGALGAIFGLLGIFTNFGANPAFDTLVMRELLHNALTRLASPSAITYIVNFCIVIFGFVAAFKVLARDIFGAKTSEPDQPTKLSALLIWSSIVSIIAFIVTDHYQAVDARYLSIILFAVFISSATFLRDIKLKSLKPLYILAAVLTGSVILGVFSVIKTYHSSVMALSDINARNNKIISELRKQQDYTVVGDYWRVMPIRQMSRGSIDVMPMQSCTQPLSALSSKSWQVDANKQDFVYLLSLDKSLTNYSSCTPEQIVAAYGQPSDRIIIAGTKNRPKELLLIYDKSSVQPQPQDADGINKRSLNQVMHGNGCNGKKTIMNIIAHEDDDLLFMSPNLSSAIEAGSCVRVVYITAGDAGNGRVYWQGREQGAKAAYDFMDGPQKDLWIDKSVKLSLNSTVVESTNPPDRFFSLIFLRLPDGNLDGNGFASTGHESLTKLETGKISRIDSLDSNSSYTSDQLLDTLVGLMNTYQPTEIRTQATTNMSAKYPDHSDHMAVGRYAKRAFDRYAGKASTPISYYVGYPIRSWAANVSGAGLDAKENAFLAYAQLDNAVCHTLQQCLSDSAYGAYLTRQYLVQ